MARYDHLSTEQAARRQRLVRSLGLTAMFIAIAALAWARFMQLADGDDPALEKGAVALKRALQGEPAAFQEARTHFGRAARGVILDAYPVFVLELTEQLEAGRVKVTEEELQPVMEHLQAGRIEEAREMLGRLPDPDKYGWLQRLFDDMSSS